MRNGSEVRVFGRSLLLLLGGLSLAPPAAAQEWRLGAQVGRIHYEGSAASATTGTSVALGVSRLSARDWLGLTAGVPLEDQPFWLVAGLWKQWRQRGPSGVGLDVSGHAFMQREVARAEPLLPIADAGVDRSGEGVGGEASVLAFAGAGPVQLEVRAGATAQTSAVTGVTVSRLLSVLEARASTDLLPVQLALEGRSWWDGDSAHTYAGASAQLVRDAFTVWGSGGGWVTGGGADPVFAVGATWALSERLQLEGSWREEGFDPLYRSNLSRSFALGMSVRVGGAGVVRAPVPASYEGGRAVIRISAGDVAGTPRIAGDFTGWEPRAMEARAGAWEFTVQLAPGVYTYAFVDEQGVWFVPESVPGRRSDGMGGYHAVLIVG